MDKRLYWILVVYVGVFLLFVFGMPKKINWSDIFTVDSKEPYALFIFEELAKDIFSDIEFSEKSLYTIDEEKSAAENYIYISSNIHFSEVELENLLKLAENGNNIFISSKSFQVDLLDTLNLVTDYIYSGMDYMDFSDIKVKSNHGSTEYYFTKTFNCQGLVTKYDSLETAEPFLFALTDDDQNLMPLAVKRKIGDGSISLCTLPYLFTNYYLVTDNNHVLCSEVISVLPDIKTNWDTYYKPKLSGEPILKRFLSTKAFKWASYLGLTLLLLHMIFSMKRKQRIIPIIKPHENRSLEFTNTIGDLYFNTYDLRDLMMKMHKHFKEYVKQRYLISDYSGTEEQTQKLMAKSGKKIGLITSINTIFKQFNTTGSVDEKTILLLNKKLQQFYDGRE